MQTLAISLATADVVMTPASPQARALSDLFGVTLAVCAVIFLVVVGLIAWSIIHFREREGSAPPRQVKGNTRLEASWTIASILVLVFLFVLTLSAMRISDPPADREPDLTVIGHQWWWEVRYADGTVTANEIHIPTNKNLLVRVEGADVIHSFWVPQLGRKVDAVPGHPNHIWIRADKGGEYLGTCTEFCGLQHAWMRILVVAETETDFLAWKSAEASDARAPGTAEAKRGLQLFRDKTCMSCHAIRGVASGRQEGPDLTHFAERRTLGAGVRPNTEANLRQWLAKPGAIKPGTRMPDFHLSRTDADALTAYIETLK